MQTSFNIIQLADSAYRESESILRKCVHCGFCTATCPTYVTLGDERDSPRGRIYLIRDMLEKGGTPDPAVVTHVDRCLSCLSCMTTCPSGVNYMHLVDHARSYIAAHHRRPLAQRLIRGMLAVVMPRPGLFRLSLIGAMLARPVAAMLPGALRAMVRSAPPRLPSPSPVDRPQVFPARGPRRARVALLTGCVQTVLNPAINEATIRLLTRHGCEVVVAQGAGCCGALSHHLGLEDEALEYVRANVAAWTREDEDGGLDAVVINASGCGTVVKDYGFLLRDDAEWSQRGERVAGLATDVTELMARLGLRDAKAPEPLSVAYHSACSLQHGQRVRDEPKRLLRDAGFTVYDVPEGHICCGSAGTYSLLQPELSRRLRDRKTANIESTGAEAVAAGNIGCMEHIAQGTRIPVLHTVQLLDWATGGPRPEGLDGG